MEIKDREIAKRDNYIKMLQDQLNDVWEKEMQKKNKNLKRKGA